MLRETEARCSVSDKVISPCCGVTDAGCCRSVLYIQMCCTEGKGRCMKPKGEIAEGAWLWEPGGKGTLLCGGFEVHSLCSPLPLCWFTLREVNVNHMCSPRVGILSRQGHIGFWGCPSEMPNFARWHKTETTFPILDIRHMNFGSKACKTLPPSAVSTAWLWQQQSV